MVPKAMRRAIIQWGVGPTIKLSAPWEPVDEEIALYDHLVGFFWTERAAASWKIEVNWEYDTV